MAEDWLSRWIDGRIGWHQADGNRALHRFWPDLESGSRVLVPLCGKSPDMLWLAERGNDVTGVEISEVAVRAFFNEMSLNFDLRVDGELQWFHCVDAKITLVCGDYFRFSAPAFDALYDRASLIALPPQMRPDYVRHTKSLLKKSATQLLITLEYDDSNVGGPPFSVLGREVSGYWPELDRAQERNDINDSPGKFRAAGLKEIIEAVWITPDCRHQRPSTAGVQRSSLRATRPPVFSPS